MRIAVGGDRSVLHDHQPVGIAGGEVEIVDRGDRAVAARGHGVIAAVHDLDLAARYADRLLIMKDGGIAADGDPRALLDGNELRETFGIERGPEGWRPLIRREGPRSSP